MEIYVSKRLDNTYTYFYISGSDFFSHSVSLSNSISPNDDDLFRVALLSNPFHGNKQEIMIKGVTVSKSLCENYIKILNVRIQCETTLDSFNEYRSIIDTDETIFLAFSGGFDSLAAKSIIPGSIQCVSIEFGGAFERESDFFSTLDTKIIRWDLRHYRLNSIKKFNENLNWRFMIAPVTLLKEKLNNIVVATGTILEASPFWFSDEIRQAPKNYSDFGLGIGVSLINPIAGLTEYSTTLIVCKDYNDEFVNRSLQSLASENSFKLHRKLCLIAAVKDKLGQIEKPYKKHIFGNSFADDFLTLYFCWKVGVEWASKYFADNIPTNIKVHDMSFVEKLNTRNLQILDNTFRNKIIEKIVSNYNIKLYSDYDYEQLGLVRLQLLSKEFT